METEFRGHVASMSLSPHSEPGDSEFQVQLAGEHPKFNLQEFLLLQLTIADITEDSHGENKHSQQI